MDSRIVNREIRHEIWPALRQVGFDAFSSRSAWQHLPGQIRAVNFQSFNAYFSSVDGCTTFSFALNLGIYVEAIAGDRPMRTAGRPTVWECHLHRMLFKRIEQPHYHRPDIWYVEPDGTNVLDVLADAREVLLTTGKDWFTRFAELDQIFDALVHEEMPMEVSGVGAKWSPQRKLYIGRAAVALGQEDLGLRILREGEAEIEAIRLRAESYGRNRRSPNPKT